MRHRAARRRARARPVLPARPAHPADCLDDTRRSCAGQPGVADTVEREGVDALLATRAQQPRPAVVADVPDLPPTPAERLLPAILRGLAASDLPSPGDVAALRQPTLVLGWPGDPGHPLSTAETLAQVLPRAELHVSRTGSDIRTWGSRIAAYLSRPRP